MKKIITILLAQIALYPCVAQVDTLHLTISGLPFDVSYKANKNMITVSKGTFDGMVFLLLNMDSNLMQYQELVDQYETHLCIQDSIESALRFKASLTNAEFLACDSAVFRLNNLLSASQLNTTACLTEVRKQKTRNRWKVAGGISIGLTAGLITGLLL